MSQFCFQFQSGPYDYMTYVHIPTHIHTHTNTNSISNRTPMSADAVSLMNSMALLPIWSYWQHSDTHILPIFTSLDLNYIIVSSYQTVPPPSLTFPFLNLSLCRGLQLHKAKQKILLLHFSEGFNEFPSFSHVTESV